MDNLHHLCIGFDNWTQVGFDSEDPKFSFGARQLEKGVWYVKVTTGQFSGKLLCFSALFFLIREAIL